MKVFVCSCILLLALNRSSLAQSKALTFEEAAKAGKSFVRLDSLYKSAVHSDVSLAVFKTPEEQQKLTAAYTKLLQDLGHFLKQNDFKWEHPTRCFNRIYLSADGRIDYFLFHFFPEQEYPVTDAKQTQFKSLLNEFSQQYQFAAVGNERFAQCSPVVYK